MKKTIVALCLVFILTACGTSPEPDYFSLDAVPGAALPDTAVIIKIERPVLAGYLDRPDFVRQARYTSC